MTFEKLEPSHFHHDYHDYFDRSLQLSTCLLTKHLQTEPCLNAAAALQTSGRPSFVLCYYFIHIQKIPVCLLTSHLEELDLFLSGRDETRGTVILYTTVWLGCWWVFISLFLFIFLIWTRAECHKNGNSSLFIPYRSQVSGAFLRFNQKALKTHKKVALLHQSWETKRCETEEEKYSLSRR